jgi:hypothetical protein
MVICRSNSLLGFRMLSYHRALKLLRILIAGSFLLGGK